MASEELLRALTNKFNIYQQTQTIHNGILGDGNGNVIISGSSRLCNIRIEGIKTVIHNERTKMIDGLPVIVGYDPNYPGIYQVLGLRQDNIGYPSGAEWGYNIPEHADTHSYMSGSGGTDPVWVNLRQFMPLSITPIGTNLSIRVNEGNVWVGGSPQYFTARTVDFSGSVPTIFMASQFVLVTINTSGSLAYTTGGSKLMGTLTYADIPAIPTHTQHVLGAVRTYTGQTIIRESRTITDILDFRFPSYEPGEVGGSAQNHSDLSQLNWSDAGHTFDTDLLIPNYNINAGSIDISGSLAVGGSIKIAHHSGSGTVLTDSNGILYGGSPYSSESPLTITDTIISHDTSGVSAGSYGAVTVNNTGHVTSGSDAAIDHANLTDTDTDGHPTDVIILPDGEGSPAYDSLKDWFDYTRSAGRLTGGAVTAHTSGSINGKVDISELEGMIFTTGALGGDLIYFKKIAVTNVEPDDGAVSWIYIDYDESGGVGQFTYKTTQTRSTINDYSQFSVGRVWRSGNTVEVMQSGHSLYNKDRRAHNRLIEKYGIMDRADGAIIGVGSTGVRTLSITDGHWYVADTPYTTLAVDTGGSPAGYLRTFYRSGSASWTESGNLTQVPNTQYNRLSDNTLQDLTANRFGVYWVFLCPEGNLYLVYGQGDYTSNEATAATLPASLPPYCVNWAQIVGKIIIQKSADVFTSVETVFGHSLTQSAATWHPDLGGRSEASSHPATAINTDTIAFSGILSAADTTVQAALETIDNITWIQAIQRSWLYL